MHMLGYPGGLWQASAQARLVSPAGSPPIAVDSKYVYWLNTANGEVRRCGLGGCANKPTTLATGQNAPGSLTVTDDALYWVNTNGTEVNMLVK
jgi:hypothetical protein